MGSVGVRAPAMQSRARSPPSASADSSEWCWYTEDLAFREWDAEHPDGGILIEQRYSWTAESCSRVAGLARVTTAVYLVTAVTAATVQWRFSGMVSGTVAAVARANRRGADGGAWVAPGGRKVLSAMG